MMTQIEMGLPWASAPGIHLQVWMAAQMPLVTRSGSPAVMAWKWLGVPSLLTANLTVMTPPEIRSNRSSGMRTFLCTHPFSAACGFL